MFTIKHVTNGEDHDVVRLWEGRNAIFSNNQVEFDLSDGTHCSIANGLVYVLNEAGKTVDTFRMKDSEHL